MATQSISRSLLCRPAKSLSIFFARSFSSSSPLSTTPVASLSASSFLYRSRPLVTAISSVFRGVGGSGFSLARGLSTRATSSSLNDPNPNWSNRPPKETILLDGCDFEHWLVVMEKPEGDPTRDEIIDSYIKTLAQVVGSEEEARMKIYSVSTRCYYAFGALVSEELSYKIKELPRVRWVLPDSYLDVKNKDYGGEPFIDGKAVPYDPKYHEEWIRNNARANERNRRNDRPRNFDRSRNFERRRENMRANQEVGNRGGAPPMPNQGPPPNMSGPPPPNMGGPGMAPPNMGNPGMAPPNMGNPGMAPPNMGNPGMAPPNMGNPGMAPPNMGNPGMAPPNMGNQGMVPPNMGNPGMAPPNMGRPGMAPPNVGQMPPPPNMGQMPPPPNMGQMPPNMGGPGMAPPNIGQMPPPNNMGGGPPNAGWPGNFQQNNGYQGQGGAPNPQYQNTYPPNSYGGNPYQG